MKRTFLAMIMAGSSMAMFAQTTPTTPTTTPTTPTTSPTTTPATNSTTSPINTTTNSQINSNTNSGNWNNTTNSTVNPNGSTTMNGTPSTSWEPGTSPYWGWSSYGIWNNGGTTNMNNTTMNNGTTMSNTTGTDMNGNLSSTGSYNANAYTPYSGTAVTSLPMNVQMRFNQDFPMSVNNQYSWNQYGDWFHTQYRANGRSLHYFYNQRGDGYALALPVIQTYVPEDIIDKALNKYGASLYSIGMVKAVDTGNVYQLGIIERGQLRMEYLNEGGASVANVWRTEEMNTAGDLNTTDANAAMGQTSTMSSDMSNTTTSGSESKETKMKWKENGVKTKIKTEDGKVKIKQKKVDD